jgi:hypothetical protein
MFEPGKSGNPNGRRAGSMNKDTKKIRDAFHMLLENNLDNMTIWLGKIADKDPVKASELVLKLSEFIVPKLARQEIVGNDGQDLLANVKFTFSTAADDNQPNYGESKESTQGEDSSEESKD